MMNRGEFGTGHGLLQALAGRDAENMKVFDKMAGFMAEILNGYFR
jgi:hypothetical protein